MAKRKQNAPLYEDARGRRRALKPLSKKQEAARLKKLRVQRRVTEARASLNPARYQSTLKKLEERIRNARKEANEYGRLIIDEVGPPVVGLTKNFRRLERNMIANDVPKDAAKYYTSILQEIRSGNEDYSFNTDFAEPLQEYYDYDIDERYPEEA